jgi:dTDP-4-amino-4,6-dideoxygalactose transaminase
VSERIGRETVTLPLFYEMTPGDVGRVCDALCRIVCEALCRIVRSRAA